MKEKDTMEIENMTLKQILDVTKLFGGGVQPQEDAPWKPGECWLFRTVTMHSVGRVVRVTATEIVLENASWVADSGRYSEAIANGFPQGAEIEYLGEHVIGRGAHVDSTPYKHDLPTKTR